jgi:hypothetical protein
MRRRAYSRAERKEQVYLTLMVRVQRMQRPAMTMYQIAKALDMTPSNHLAKILHEMARDGILQCVWVDHRPGIKKCVFELKEGTWDWPEKVKRAINIMRGGRQTGEIML